MPFPDFTVYELTQFIGQEIELPGSLQERALLVNDLQRLRLNETEIKCFRCIR